MSATLEVPMSKDKKKRSDWRTSPRDEFVVGGERVSFATYLVSEYPRGKDFKPCSSIGKIWKLNDSPRDKKGRLSGKPRLSIRFVNWIAGEDIEGIAPADLPPGFTHAEVRAALVRVKRRFPDAFAVLEWRQGLGPSAELTSAEYLQRHHLASHATLTERFYKAIREVLNEIDRGRGGVLDV